MVSDTQQKANEENAKLGGVKTEEGKEISKFNALKHGVLLSGKFHFAERGGFEPPVTLLLHRLSRSAS